MISWLIIWFITFLLFLVVPVIFSKERRLTFYHRVFLCQWSYVYDQGQPHDAQGGQYVLSRAQEDELRYSWLMEKLHMYSSVIDESMVQKLANRHETTEKIESSGRSDEEDMEAGVYSDDLGDIEAPPVDLATPSRQRAASTDTVETHSSEADSINMDEFMGDSNTEIEIPVPGECRQDCLPKGVIAHRRCIPNGCAICLCPFEPEEEICWSANENCSHAFHKECVLEWLIASGRKQLRRQRRNDQQQGISITFSEHYERVINFKKLCPCCRQEFLPHPYEPSVTEKVSNDSEDLENPPDDEPNLESVYEESVERASAADHVTVSPVAVGS